MKRLGILILVVMLTAALLPVTNATAATYGTVVGGWLRLRTAPSFSATILKSYNTGTVVEILGTSGDWYNVKTPDNKAGYMYSTYVSTGGGGGTTAYVTSTNGYGVRLRTGPSKGYRIIAVYDVGTQVTVLQEGIIWSRIQIGSTVGYMMSEFLTTTPPGPTPTTPPSGDMATVWSSNGYGVRLRSGAGTNYSIIGLYSVGTRVAVQTRGTDWDYILVGSRLGYMMNEFLIYDHPNVPEATGITVTADSSTGMQGEYVDLDVTVTGSNLSDPAYTLAVTSGETMAEISGDDLHIFDTATVGTVIEVTATTTDEDSGGHQLTDTCTVTVTAAAPLVTAFGFDEPSVTVSIASGDVERRIGYSISGYNLSTPSFSLNVPSAVTAHVTATIDTSTEEVVINVADTITVGTMFTITGTTTDNDSGGNPKVATIAFTVTDDTVTLTSIELVPTLSSVRWNETSQINATLHYSDGSDVNAAITTQYTLSITDGTAATISSGSKTLLPDTTLLDVPNETVTVTGTAVDDPTKTDTAVITIIARNVPGAPTLNSAVAGNGSVALDWDVQTDDGGTAITGYIVTYNDDPLAAKLPGPTTGASTTEAVVSGLTNGTTYYFYLQASNSRGDSDYSAYKTATPAATAPSAPTALTVTAEADQSVSLSWGAPTTDGGSALTKYRVNYSNGGPETLFLDNIDPTTTTATVTGLTNGTTYNFYVYAFNNAGGTPSASIPATTTGTPATVPSAPQTLAVTSHGDGSVSLSWVEPASTGGSALTEYTIIYNDGSDHTFTRAPGDVLNTTETVTGLTNGTTYTFTVYAVNAKGTSAASNTATGTPSTVPGPPTSPAVTAHTSSSVSLSWVAPANNGGSALTSYTIFYNSGGSDTQFVRASGDELNVTETVTGLAANTPYTFKIYANNANGASSAATTTQTTDP